MIFIFGYQPVSKTVGPVNEKSCPNCHHKKHWLLKKSTDYISLFFLPIIPVKSTQFESCPTCNFKTSLTREEFFKQEKIAQLNKEAVEKDMDNTEYERRLAQIQ